jgi:GH15 family glucan-1,4-alpha-glucosidase
MHGPAIGDHAAIGDGRSVALVTRRGEIDWLCWPRFDSPAVFARLLDPRGGVFSIAPAGHAGARRRYLPGTNVLETRFRAARGEAVLYDLMPVEEAAEGARTIHPEREILRVVRCLGGEVELEVILDPRPRFGAARPVWRDAGALGLRLEDGCELYTFLSEPRLPLAPEGGVRARLRLRSGETARFSFSHATEAPAALPALGHEAEEALWRTAALWRQWAARVAYDGPFRDEVERSALVLKLLVHAPSGAVVAAPTTSLPEQIGGGLNWDYRYCWLRDASMTVRALFGLGFRDEAESFVGWLLHSTRLTRPALRIMYDVYGRAPPRERELPLEGYRGSRPVRLGNGARDQLQLDVYGEVVDAAAQLVLRGVALDRETSKLLCALGRYVCQHWREPDEGIWEPRGGRHQNTYSKVLCWVALNRLVELHDTGHLCADDPGLFVRERDELRRTIEQRGWNEAICSYTQNLDDDRVDAALLQLAWYGFERADSPRMRATLRRIEAELGAGRGLLRRYRRAAGWEEGAFGICGFWAAELLALGAGTAEEAESRLASLVEDANDVGLFAEEVDPDTGEALGNFPQAFTHIGLVSACLTLRNRLTGRRPLRHRGPLPHAAAAREEARL